MAERELLLGLAAEIVSAHVSHNAVIPDQLPALIQQVFNTLTTVEQTTTAPPKPEPAVPIKQSAKADHLVCLDCGKHFSMLKRHLLMTDHKLTPETVPATMGTAGVVSTRCSELCQETIRAGEEVWFGSEWCRCEEHG